MSKRKTPPEIGYRASEEFIRYVKENGLTFEQASQNTGIDRKASSLWWNGHSPSVASLIGLAAIGADVGYIITGKRTPKVVHAHWEVSPFYPAAGKRYRCSNCKKDNIYITTYLVTQGLEDKYCKYCGAIMDEEDNK